MLVVALLVIILIGGLAGLFIASARMIRHDINDRFDRLRVRLEHEAAAILQVVLNKHTQI